MTSTTPPYGIQAVPVPAGTSAAVSHPFGHMACDMEIARLRAELARVTAERDDLAGQVAMLRSRLSVAEGPHVR